MLLATPILLNNGSRELLLKSFVAWITTSKTDRDILVISQYLNRSFDPQPLLEAYQFLLKDLYQQKSGKRKSSFFKDDINPELDIAVVFYLLKYISKCLEQVQTSTLEDKKVFVNNVLLAKNWKLEL